MTCEEFERIVTDLACEFLIEAATRKRGLAHARACSRCAVRLQQERGLTSVLNEVANRETVQANPRLKTALMVALQQEMKRSREQRGQGPQRVPPSPGSRSDLIPLPLSVVNSKAPVRRPAWLMATAAALAAAALLVAWQFSRNPSNHSVKEQPAVPGQAVIMPGPSASDAAQPGNANPAPPRVPPPAAVSDRVIESPRQVRRRLRSVFRPELANSQRLSSEEVTEFIPLTAITETTGIPSGTIMRVELPRASLLAMGLPMNAERGQEIVKADVVVGDDGLARAIRLVY